MGKRKKIEKMAKETKNQHTIVRNAVFTVDLINSIIQRIQIRAHP